MGRTILDTEDIKSLELRERLEKAQCLSGPHVLQTHNRFMRAWCTPILLSCNRAHFFDRLSGEEAHALCGFWCDIFLLYEAGTFPHCKTCERILAARKENR